MFQSWELIQRCFRAAWICSWPPWVESICCPAINSLQQTLSMALLSSPLGLQAPFVHRKTDRTKQVYHTGKLHQLYFNKETTDAQLGIMLMFVCNTAIWIHKEISLFNSFQFVNIICRTRTSGNILLSGHSGQLNSSCVWIDARDWHTNINFLCMVVLLAKLLI